MTKTLILSSMIVSIFFINCKQKPDSSKTAAASIEASADNFCILPKNLEPLFESIKKNMNELSLNTREVWSYHGAILAISQMLENRQVARFYEKNGNKDLAFFEISKFVPDEITGLTAKVFHMSNYDSIDRFKQMITEVLIVYVTTYKKIESIEDPVQRRIYLKKFLNTAGSTCCLEAGSREYLKLFDRLDQPNKRELIDDLLESFSDGSGNFDPNNFNESVVSIFRHKLQFLNEKLQFQDVSYAEILETLEYGKTLALIDEDELVDIPIYQWIKYNADHPEATLKQYLNYAAKNFQDKAWIVKKDLKSKSNFLMCLELVKIHGIRNRISEFSCLSLFDKTIDSEGLLKQYLDSDFVLDLVRNGQIKFRNDVLIIKGMKIEVTDEDTLKYLKAIKDDEHKAQVPLAKKIAGYGGLTVVLAGFIGTVANIDEIRDALAVDKEIVFKESGEVRGRGKYQSYYITLEKAGDLEIRTQKYLVRLDTEIALWGKHLLDWDAGFSGIHVENLPAGTYELMVYPGFTTNESSQRLMNLKITYTTSTP